MSKYHHPDVLDNGLSRIKTNTQRVALIKNYTAGDSYATVTGNIVAAAATTSTDFTLADQGTLGRKVTSTAKAPTATTASLVTDNLHFALLDDTNSKVLTVTDETTDQVVTTGNTVSIPALTFNFNQPV
ncbi:MAG: hypothetical protein M0R47_19885 [Methylobacter sp.]|uniref:hypothetical protein n=1 Tax=Methylobacter sp. TaxID=2051955 RepID=UPI0025D51895|nr:hypothetical protein [Methylobacter sp.]MCK9622783.1 hypothetical protein [Methylobacter sp.]